jgi:spermidine synthase
MKPWKTLATDGKFTLRQREREYMVLADGKILMSSRQHGDEPGLVRIGCARIDHDSPKILVGGLGFGFTLRAALDHAPDLSKVTVNEPSKSVVEWNRGPLASLSGHALGDDRVTVEVGDVQRVLSKHRRGFDVILLDIDNGPFAVDIDDDMSLYSIGGLSSVRASLASGGRLAVLSAGTHPGFNKRLIAVGFSSTSVEPVGDSLVFVGDVA